MGNVGKRHSASRRQFKRNANAKINAGARAKCKGVNKRTTKRTVTPARVKMVARARSVYAIMSNLVQRTVQSLKKPQQNNGAAWWAITCHVKAGGAGGNCNQPPPIVQEPTKRPPENLKASGPVNRRAGINDGQTNAIYTVGNRTAYVKWGGGGW